MHTVLNILCLIAIVAMGILVVAMTLYGMGG